MTFPRAHTTPHFRFLPTELRPLGGTMRRAFGALLLPMLLLTLAFSARAQTTVYSLTTATDFSNFVAKNSGGFWKLAASTDANHHAAMDVTLPASSIPVLQYDNFISNYSNPNTTGLSTGGQYIVKLTFTVLTAPAYPDTFYMFARNTAGNQYDRLQNFTGTSADPVRTIVMPLDLPVIGSGTWSVSVGMQGPGAIRVSSFTIVTGNPYQTDLPVENGTPSSTLPSGVTAATGSTTITLTAPSTANPVTITLAPPTYNFVADTDPSANASTPANNATALQNALKACVPQAGAPAHGTTLLIPKGTYRLAPFIPANSPSGTTGAFSFSGLQDFTFDGQGSTLIFENISPPTNNSVGMFLSNCARMVMQNVFFDWDWATRPIASLCTTGNTVTIDTTANTLTCDLTFRDLDGTQTALVLKSDTPWEGIFPMNPTTLVATGLTYKPTVTRTAESAANVLRAVFNDANAPIVANTYYCIRHMYYDMLAFKVSDCTNLEFSKVNFYSWPGMGWLIEGATSNLQFVDCSVERNSSRKDPLTLAADGIHVDESQGNISITDCHFTGLGDDTMNIHDDVYTGSITFNQTDTTQFTMVNCGSYQLKINAGDFLQFYNADFSPLNNSTPIQVASVSYSTIAVTTIPGSTPVVVQLPTTTVKLTSKVPAGMSATSIVRNTRFNTSNVFIHGNTEQYTNGRGLLLSASNATVSGNYFYQVFGSPFEFETQLVGGHWNGDGKALSGNWWEGHGGSNILVTGNTFDYDDASGRYDGDDIYAGSVLPWGPTAYPLFNQITVTDNLFQNCPGPSMSFTSCTNVVANLNSIQYMYNMSGANQYSGAIQAMLSSGLGLGGNTWDDRVATAPPYQDGVVYDPSTTTNIITATNARVLNPPSK